MNILAYDTDYLTKKNSYLTGGRIDFIVRNTRWASF